MRVFVNKPFARFAGKADISRDVLCGAVRRAEAGLIDADLARVLATGTLTELDCHA